MRGWGKARKSTLIKYSFLEFQILVDSFMLSEGSAVGSLHTKTGCSWELKEKWSRNMLLLGAPETMATSTAMIGLYC